MLRPALAALWLVTAPASAEECRLALALAVDVSRSVDRHDFAIQEDGIIAALADPVVRAAFLRPERPVALALFHWSGQRDQEVIVDWTLIRGEGDLARVSDAVRAARQPLSGRPTGLGGALDFGRQLLDAAPPCGRQVIDVSGDGRNNDGIGPRAIYDRRDFGAIVVNGLAIGEHEIDVVRYYRTEVIRGPGAFVEVAETHADFPPAFRRKLLRELAEPVLGAAGAGARGG
jgi:hypothetical protein